MVKNSLAIVVSAGMLTIGTAYAADNAANIAKQSTATAVTTTDNDSNANVTANSAAPSSTSSTSDTSGGMSDDEVSGTDIDSDPSDDDSEDYY